MFFYQQIFNDLMETRNGIEVDSIHFVSDEIYSKDEQEKLTCVGLKSYEPILFSNYGIQYPPGMGKQSLANMRGVTICVRNDTKICQVIFFPKDVPIKEKDPEVYCEIKHMLQLCALVHELGHVEDMQKSINFSFGDKPTIKLIEAEAYANTYALNFLNRLDSKEARNMLADAICKWKQSNSKFYKNLYQKICMSIGKGRLKKWNKA